MQFLADLFSSLPETAALARALDSRGLYAVEGICLASLPPLLAALKRQGRTFVLLCENEREMAESASLLQVYFPSLSLFGSRDLSLYSGQAKSEVFGARRLQTLVALTEGKTELVLTTAEAALQATLPPEVLAETLLTLSCGQETDPAHLLETLVALGFSRCERVEGQGQFACRGGIVDFFPPHESEAVRVEFFGDTVERICSFDVQSQRSTDPREQVHLAPARELYLLPDERARALARLTEALAQETDPLRRESMQAQEAALSMNLEAAEDTLLSFCYRHACLLDYLTDACLFVRRPAAVRESLLAAARAEQTLVATALEGGACFLSPMHLLSVEALDALPERFALVSCDALSSPAGARALFSFDTRPAPSFGERREVLFSVLEDLVRARLRVAILAPSGFAAQSLSEQLCEAGFPAVLGRPEAVFAEGGTLCVFSSPRLLQAKGRALGLECPAARFCLLTQDSEDTAPHVARPARSTSRHSSTKEAIRSYADLSVGDYVVHEAHGIAVFDGIETIDGRDFLKLRYAGGDFLYVPCSNLSNVSKYIGRGADGTLALDRMGRDKWNETRRRAKRAAKSIAKELIALYSEREHSDGHAFCPDTPWQAEFEAGFEFEETRGQLVASAEVKADMEKSRPMDRLLCGDVGFGKTEVALRAVFKCIMDGKQAAILAPTTLLAEQHFRTVRTRLRGYPVRVELLSRFTTARRVGEALAALASGECDVVVGTHRLLQKDVRFRDLGLVVVDEEQRFGVTHKEALKVLSRGVDVLTLTATPIPRTLNMALSGVRDLSLLEEAPGDRQPVQTIVCPFDSALVLSALQKELARRGQAFYLVNSVEALPARAAWLQKALPEARIRYGHGRLTREEMSSLWQELVDGEIDVLVCTTIIETGIDLPMAGTLIVEHAHRFGLSQLHQLRGRVGRSFRKAYAYFTFPAERALTELQEKRLEAIRQFARFGSGFQLAMRDLELRGAGSLLGAEQSGHMEKVGYELYMRILQDAVREERGETVETTPDCYVDLPFRARLSEQYVPSSADRIHLYRKFSDLKDEEGQEALRRELLDRFGPLPQEAEALFSVARLRARAVRAGFTKLSLSEGVLSFYFTELPAELIALLSAVYSHRFFVSTGERARLNLRLAPMQSFAEALEDFFFHLEAFSEDLKRT